MLDKHFLMTIDWLKTYARRKDLQMKYNVSKRACDLWKGLILDCLQSSLPWPNVEHRHILEPDFCRWHRSLGIEYCCLAVDTQFTQTTSQSSSDRLRYYSGKSKANGVKIETGVIHKGPFQRFIFHVFGPEPASTHDFAIVQETLLPVLKPGEQLSGDTGYTGSASIIVPFKRSRTLTDTHKDFNTDVSRAHVPVEHCNREINIFAACSQRFRHRLRKGGMNTGLQADVFKVCVFMANRNILDSHGQTNAWSIPSRPRRSGDWVVKHLSDEFWTQEKDDQWGPRGPIRSSPERAPAAPRTTFNTNSAH